MPLNDGKLNLIECKSGKKYGLSGIRRFAQLSKTKYEIEGRRIICTTENACRIASSTYSYPICSIQNAIYGIKRIAGKVLLS